ncbi:hypothetical protein CEK28_11810 [Xenophilus sp. AP218F]|nr:hypothetical protein [Chromobacterium sp. ASV5]OWY38769.1 hypothetical protein CEK28_11810 [Xenophilus sp. AP218F]
MKRSVLTPIVLICLGAVWFLKSTGLLPNTTTLLALLLIAAGVLLFISDGFNKSTLVSSPMLVYSGIAVYLNDTLLIRISHLASFGMMLLGALMLLARLPRVPERSPTWPRRHGREQD